MMRVVVAEGHSRERKKREDSLQKKTSEKGTRFYRRWKRVISSTPG
jgi:hypothetical protein